MLLFTALQTLDLVSCKCIPMLPIAEKRHFVCPSIIGLANLTLSFSAGSTFLTVGWRFLCLWLLKLGKLLGLTVIPALSIPSLPLSEALLFPASFILSPTHIDRTNALATFALFPPLISFCCSELRAVPYHTATISQAKVGTHSFRSAWQGKHLLRKDYHENLAGIRTYSEGPFSFVFLEQK